MPLNKSNEKLTEKIQVLLLPSDLRTLYQLINQASIDNMCKPLSLSTYVRLLIKNELASRTMS